MENEGKLESLKDEDLLNEYYSNYYEKIFSKGKYLGIESVPHILLERWTPSYGRTLEIGPTNGQHLEFLDMTQIEEYVMVDIRENFELKNKVSRSKKLKYKILNAESEEIVFLKEFDKVLTTCLLHHLKNVEKTLTLWRKLLKRNGVANFYIPLDSSLLYKVGRELTSVRAARKAGIQRKTYMRILKLDHPNSVDEILSALKNVYSKDRVRFHYWPTRLPIKSLNIYLLVEIVRGGD
jgi:SAM-dependent methyltransferase